MKTLGYRGVVLSVAVVAVLAVAAWANVYLLDFQGYDYWEPAGCYNALGDVTGVNSDYLTFDYANNEYTFSLRNVCTAMVDSTSIPGMIIWSFNGGTVDVFEDADPGGTHRDYGINPPNATAPSTFEDGTLVLGGDINTMTMLWNSMTGEGSLEGTMDLNRGSQLVNIPMNQRTGWTLAALRDVQNPIPTPEGYFWQIDGYLEISDPIPTQKTSWGELKQQYTGGE
jgi:hypothetical protein